MRHILKSSELPHAWAHQTQPSGRCPASMSFDGPLIRSYGTGIARHIVNKRGEKAVLFNETGYSISTSKHQGWIRRALPPSVPVFSIGNLSRGSCLDYDNAGVMLFDYAVKSAAKARASVARVKSDWRRDSLAAQEASWLKQARDVSAFFGLRRKVDDKAIERLAKAEARATAALAKARKAQEAKRDAELAEAADAWVAGADVGTRVYSFSRVLLRREDGEVVTSRGARVPVADAERTFRFALAARERGWHRNGETHKVGSYEVDAVNAQGVVAGCHRIEWREIERFGKAMAWA